GLLPPETDAAETTDSPAFKARAANVWLLIALPAPFNCSVPPARVSVAAAGKRLEAGEVEPLKSSIKVPALTLRAPVTALATPARVGGPGPIWPRPLTPQIGWR